MADKPQLNITAKLDRNASKKAIQSQLDNISKNLKLTIGATSSSIVSNAEKDAKKVSKTYMSTWAQLDAKQAEMDIKFAKALEKKEKRLRDSETKQQKAIEQIATQQEKALQQEQAIRYKIQQQQEQANTKELASVQKYTLAIEESQNSAIKNAEALNKYRMSGSQKTELDWYLKTINEINPAMAKNSDELLTMKNSADKASRGIRDLKTSVTASGKSALKFSEYLKNAATAFGLWLSVTTVTFTMIRSIKSGVEQVKNLDDSMVELRKVTDLTDSQLKKFVTTAQSLTDEVGRTTSEVISATAAFSRMGYSIDEAFSLAENALLLTNIGDGITDVNESSELLISTMKGFGLEASSARHIIDSLNEISNKYAVTTGDLADGIQRVASVSTASGASFEQTLGLLTAMIEISRNADKSSTALKTLMLRIQGLDESGESLGTGYVAKFNEMFEDIADVSITVDGKLRNIYDIITDLGSKLGSLSQEQKIYLATEAVGIRQANEFINLLSNYKTAIASTETAINSQNSALIENSKYMDSITGKTAQFNEELEKLWTNGINSNTVKNIIDFGTVLLEIANNVGLVNTALMGTTIAILALKGQSIATFLSGLIPVIIGVETTLVAIAPQLIVIGAAIGGLIILQDSLFESTQEMNSKLEEYNNNLANYESQLKSIIDSEDASDIQSKKRIATLERLIELEKERVRLQQNKINNKSLSDTYKEADSTISEYRESLEDIRSLEYAISVANSDIARRNLQKAYDEMISKSEDLKISMLEELQTLEELKSSGVEFTVEQQTQYNILVDLTGAFDELMSVTSEVTASTTALTAKEILLNKAMEEFAQTGSISANTLTELISKFPDMAEEIGLSIGEIDKYKLKFKDLSENQAIFQKYITDETIKQVQARIDAYELEMQALASIITAGGLTADTLEAEKKYGRVGEILQGLKNQFIDLNAQSVALGSLDFSTSKSSTSSDILDNYKAQRQAISDISNEISILNDKIEISEGQERIDYQVQLAQKYREQMDAVHNYSEAIRLLELDYAKYDSTTNKFIATSKKLTEDQIKTIDSLNDTLADNGNEWWGLVSSQKSALETMEKEAKEYADNVADYMEDLYSKLASSISNMWEDASDSRKESLQSEINDLKDYLDELEKEYKDTSDKIKKDDIVEQIAELETARAMWINTGGKGVKREIYDIDEELSDLNSQLAEINREEEYNAEKEATEDKIELLEDEIDAEEKALKKRLSNRENFAKSQELIEKKSIESIIDILGSYDSDFMLDGEIKGEEWVDAFREELESYFEELTGMPLGLEIEDTSGGRTKSNASYNKSLSTPALTSQDKATQATIEYMNSPTTSEENKKSAKDWLDKYGKFHTGIENGLVGNAPIPDSIKDLFDLSTDETLVKARIGEGVFTQSQMLNASNGINYLKTNGSSGGQTINAGGININVSAVINNDSDISALSNSIAYQTKNQLLSYGIK